MSLALRKLSTQLQKRPLQATERRIRRSSRQAGSAPTLFALDLHISVIEDLKAAAAEADAEVIHWSISGHNHIMRGRFSGTDPVDVVNARTWRSLDEDMISQFQQRYAPMLRKCDGFIACYSPAFAELFRGLGKPILVYSATRYEVPYSSQSVQWRRLDGFLRSEYAAGRMIVAANNRGDRDYVGHFTGLPVRYVPSLCDYTRMTWAGADGPRVVFARDAALVDAVARSTDGAWGDVHRTLGRRYSWSALSSCSEVLVVPYNISTMTLFELASAGVPVTVPSRDLLKEWTRDFTGVLSELSFFQVEGLDISNLSGLDPNNSGAEGFFDWWLDRADFYDASLMPNVRTIACLDDLRRPHPFAELPEAERSQIVRERNARLAAGRQKLVDDFIHII